jgi:hypothetical protein
MAEVHDGDIGAGLGASAVVLVRMALAASAIVAAGSEVNTACGSYGSLAVCVLADC